jgi:hypothetical protein
MILFCNRLKNKINLLNLVKIYKIKSNLLLMELIIIIQSFVHAYNKNF